MTDRVIKANALYDHERFGRVLVTAIGSMYATYDIDRETGQHRGTLVYFYDRYDGWGGIRSRPIRQSASEFLKEATFVKYHDYDDWEDSA